MRPATATVAYSRWNGAFQMLSQRQLVQMTQCAADLIFALTLALCLLVMLKMKAARTEVCSSCKGCMYAVCTRLNDV